MSRLIDARKISGFTSSKIVGEKDVKRESPALFRRDASERMSLEERENHDLSGAPNSRAAVFFSFNPVSPYDYPLDGQHYEPNAQFGPSGLCPLCNNVEHRAMDQHFLKNLDNPGAWARFGFSEKEVVEHLVNHIGPVYTRTGREILSSISSRTSVDLLDDDLRAKVSGATRRAFARVRKAEDEERSARYDDETLLSFPGQEIEEKDFIPPSVFGRPKGADAKEWYAFDGRNQKGQLRPWGDKRMTTEIDKRAEDSIVFYDEMVMVRRMGLNIYHEIMDVEGEPIVDKSGEIIGNKEKNYTAALSAAKLVKDVAMDLAKLAIIGVKLEGQGEKMRQLSPTMQAMINDIGILEKRDLPSGSIDEAVAEVMGPSLPFEEVSEETP